MATTLVLVNINITAAIIISPFNLTKFFPLTVLAADFRPILACTSRPQLVLVTSLSVPLFPLIFVTNQITKQ